MTPVDRAEDRPSGRAVLARIFGEGENPLSWGLPIGRLGATRVRVHLLFVVYLLAVLIFTLPGHQMGVVFVLPMLVSLCVVVCAHELGHWFVCRKQGGHTDELMLWPLGGLSEPTPPHAWEPVLKTALAGIIVQLLMFSVLGTLVFLLTGTLDSLVFNPLSIAQRIGEIKLRDGTTPWWLVAAWSFYAVNLMVMLANLIPMFPLDGGRVLQSLLWKTQGYTRSVWVSVHAGLVCAVALVFVGATMADGKVLLALGIFGGLVCVSERRKLQFLKYADMIPGFSTDPPADPDVGDPEPDRLDSEEIDRVLAKISAEGIGALSRAERALLKRATENSRKAQ
ncbi:MAG: site-2 protease family protein [Phycisphaerales bacterium]|nr:site-2 protease family protein [Phycisphaerales bacterium]